MKIIIERLEPATKTVSGVKTTYYTFWVRFYETTGELLYVTTAGWRYWPDKRKVGSPAIFKGQGKGYFNTLHFPAEVYNIVHTQVEEALGITGPAPIAEAA